MEKVVAIMLAISIVCVADRCCYGSCSDQRGCHGPADWCSQTQKRCENNCNGHFCPDGPSPRPTPTPSPSGFHQGPITIKQDSNTLNLHVAALTPHLVTSQGQGTSITMKWGGETRAFVVNEPLNDMPAKNYYNFTLLNRELSYDIDISTVGCSCNAALFFVSMPGYNPDGSVAHGDYNPYYCDANKVGGVWCWEQDSIESNMHVMTTTPHKCVSPPGNYISSCDKGGCATNAFSVDPNGMCPDAHCKIDTRRPFRIFQSYEVDSGSMKLTRITNRLVQGSSTFQWTVCNDAGYLEQMTDALKGKMTMVFQLWGTSYDKMSWLDKKTGCSGDCNSNTATVTFSNIEISSLKSDDTVVV